MKNYFLYSFFIIFMINFDHVFGMEEICVATTCNRYNTGQVIRQLWNAAKYITPLGKQLSQVLLKMSKNLKEPDHKLNAILTQSMWSMMVYSGFDPNDLSISCVFEKLLYLTILDDEFDTKEYNRAITNYGALMIGARNFTLRSSLTRSSCPISNPHVTQPRPQECMNGSLVNLFLEKYESTLPSDIISLIASLMKSQNAKDRTIAIILSTLSIEPLNGYYACVLESPEFLKLAQLMACDVPILPCCCKIREEDFRGRIAARESVDRIFLEGLLKK